ncbi:Oxidoreductase family, NAD-binding Rossmann fold [Poriferisphaera corsica]|uniref:Oxidoreductase family, NAD-binding Rossmann fold n=1 Tax=Poriferisphaera corsica TaxID=2528020 RepID=A0A517YRL1_9BACT|nr:Gfo/Idh/MocA family oxidoreductase [Poriferisphaera corsica]QDU32857.1 Oxidoreductase family, NAD-binding Rossmann fold [Poriferisphaera corsica]
MLKVGLIDHHLDNFHTNIFLDLFKNELKDEEIVFAFAYESDEANQEKDWCAENGVERCGSIEEVIEKADALMVLAPDNIDDHLALGKAACASGKRVYIDKYLSNSYSDAKELIDTCQANGTEMISSSSLRFCEGVEKIAGELDGEVSWMQAKGPGSWPWYACHTLAPVLRLMGDDVEKVIHTGSEDNITVTLKYRDGRSAMILVNDSENMWDHYGWEFTVKVGKELTRFEPGDHRVFYGNMMKEVARFFKTGETCITIGMLEMESWLYQAVADSLANGNEWIARD